MELTRQAINSLYPSDNARLGEINEMYKTAGFNSYVFYAERNDNMNCGQLITDTDMLALRRGYLRPLRDGA